MNSRLLSLLLLVATATPALAQRGSIAVFPFGTNARTQDERETARQIQDRFERQLQESKRFLAVLPRSSEVEAALSKEYEKSMDPASLDALVRISQDKRMNANYVVDGYLEQHELKSRQDDKGKPIWAATSRMRIRIVNVETGALFLNDVLTVDNSSVAEAASRIEDKAPEKGGSFKDRVFDAVRRKVDEQVSESIAGGIFIDRTPNDAINQMRKNADAASRNFLAKRLGYFLRDYEVDDAGNPNTLILRAGTDLRPGARLEVREQVASRMNPGEVRTTKLGTIKVDRIEDGDAYATLVDGKDRIGAVLKKKNPSITINTPQS